MSKRFGFGVLGAKAFSTGNLEWTQVNEEEKINHHLELSAKFKQTFLCRHFQLHLLNAQPTLLTKRISPSPYISKKIGQMYLQSDHLIKESGSFFASYLINFEARTLIL